MSSPVISSILSQICAISECCDIFSPSKGFQFQSVLFLSLISNPSIFSAKRKKERKEGRKKKMVLSLPYLFCHCYCVSLHLFSQPADDTKNRLLLLHSSFKQQKECMHFHNF